MNILFDGRPIRHPHTGVATYCSEFILHSFDTKNFNLTPYFQSYKNSNSVAEEFITTSKILKFYKQSFFPRKVENLFQEFTNLRPFSSFCNHSVFDIIHETYFAKLNKLDNKSKLVCTIHDLIPLEFPHFFNRTNSFFSKGNLKRQILKSDAVITVSEYTKKVILNSFNVPEEKIFVIPIGVSSSVFSPVPKKNSYNLVDYFVTVGNIEPRKNHLTAAKAIAKLNDYYKSNFKYVVIGRKLFNSESIINKMRKLLGDNLVITDFLPISDRNYLISNSLAHIFPSSYEGFGIPALEAYHLKSLTLLAKNSSLVELAVDPWQLFETFSSDNLFSKLSSIVDKKAPSDLIFKQQEFSNIYRWENNINKTFEVYSSVL